MLTLKTILNRVHPLKSFVYQAVHFRSVGETPVIIAKIQPRKNSKPICSGCNHAGPCYDHLPERQFQFVPLWAIPMYLLYTMRRVDCLRCGVKVEVVPWADGKNQLTNAFRLFLSNWAKRLCWKDTAEIFGTSWNSVYRSVKWVVDFGLKHRSLKGITALGIDEVMYLRGHYMTLVYQIDVGYKRLLAVTDGHKGKSLRKAFRQLGDEVLSKIQFICTDMWKPYLEVIKTHKKLAQTLHVLDRFHIVKNLNKAVNEVRASESKKRAQEGYDAELLKHTRYCFLKNPENLTPKQETKLAQVLQYDLKSVRAYLLKESFQLFWGYTSVYWAEWFLKKWCARAMRSRLEPIKRFVRTMRKHQALLMNYFKAKKKYNSGVVEGLNRKVNLTMRKAYGYKSFDVLKIALFHTMGELPEPKNTHRFW